MSNSNLRNPYTDDAQAQDTIQRLVANAAAPPADALTRKAPRYPSEVDRAGRRLSLDLEPELKQELKDLAQQIANPRQLSAVTQALLEYALAAHRAGRIKIQPCIKHGSIAFEVTTTESTPK